MTETKYHVIRNWLLQHRYCSAFVILLNQILPAMVYCLYPLSLLYLLIVNRFSLIIPYVVVPAAGFTICTVIRDKIDAPRPYETLDLSPLVTKNTKGHSFPSRHVACAAVISISAAFVFPLLAVILLVICVLIMLCRVLVGVHYIRDVFAGFALGAVVGILGNLVL